MQISAQLVVATCLTLLAASASAQTFSFKAPQLPHVYELTVDSFTIDGETKPAPAQLCASPAFPSTCLTNQGIIKADQDSVTVSFKANVTLPDTKPFVIFQACYSKNSSFNRPWRADTSATNISANAACQKWKIMKPGGVKANPAGDTLTFHPDDETPSSTVYFRAILYCAPGKPPCGFGNSAGFVQLQKINTRPKSVHSATIGMCFAGPVILALALPLDFYLTKRRAGKHA